MRAMKSIIVVFAIAGLTTNAAADSYHVQTELELYGDLNQNTIPDWGDMACGPTAAVNSFVYLQEKYPDTYGISLVPETIFNDDYDLSELQDVAEILGGLDYMKTIAAGATFHNYFIYGKMRYIEDNNENITIYRAQDSYAWGTDPAKPGWVDIVYPTWQFLYQELVACRDVEIGLTWQVQGEEKGHFLTLTSFHWDDSNDNGVIDDGNAYIDFIDPNTGAYGTALINQIGGPDTRIYTNYAPYAWISVAASEGPIPEPTTMGLLGFGLAMLVTRRKQSLKL